MPTRSATESCWKPALQPSVVTPEAMRLFALDCLRWAELTDDPAQRDLMINVAKTWMKTASVIERHVMNGARPMDTDLRSLLD